ncbi:hypothetical protein N798_11960 [Knoellia flava TL1]|uniref:Uncharacterized protein n=1 Tax=Knoellia flava TL1 TaxID=1385518 RepID=A0ABR4XC68_9MICO|nr:hypothetical protein [Knoellia flava]KGN30062.1 hypothetical protein N798_11960 [Knoellia flava TL1]
MEPSSLIFLVIIGIWAAYFVQYWVRRREHLATIRSVDAFSETMRVLERRSPLPSVDTGSLAPRTYAVSPARAMRPQVTVKRAEAHTMSRVELPASRPTVPAAAPSSTAARPAPTGVAPMHPSRATRGTVLLVGLAATVVFAILSVLGVLVAWAPLVPLALAVGGFAWLRAGVQSEIRARRELRREAHQQARRDAQRSAVVAARTAATVPAPTARRQAPVVESEVVVEDSTDPSSGEADTADGVAPEAAPFDVSAEAATEHGTQSEPVAEAVVAEPAAAQPVAGATVADPPAQVTPVLPEVDEDDIPLTWDPRPVPPPTYTMKARAPERPVPTAEVEPHAEAEETAYDELPERRISGL